MNDGLLSPTERRQIVALLRFAGRDGLAMMPAADGATVALAAATGAARTVAAPLLRKAVALGLVLRTGDRLQAAAAARTFLRRALSDGDEEVFLDQHRELATAEVIVEGCRQTVRRNTTESPLAGLARIRDRNGGAFLPADAMDAGERLLADFTRGQLQPRMTASWEPRLSVRGSGRPGGVADLTDAAVAARMRLAQAVEAMGPELSGVALDVCCFMKGLELVERERQWPVRSAKLLLRAALMTLARHYNPPQAPRRADITHWGAGDFRPEL